MLPVTPQFATLQCLVRAFFSRSNMGLALQERLPFFSGSFAGSLVMTRALTEVHLVPTFIAPVTTTATLRIESAKKRTAEAISNSPLSVCFADLRF